MFFGDLGLPVMSCWCMLILYNVYIFQNLNFRLSNDSFLRLFGENIPGCISTPKLDIVSIQLNLNDAVSGDVRCT